MEKARRKSKIVKLAYHFLSVKNLQNRKNANVHASYFPEIHTQRKPLKSRQRPIQVAIRTRSRRVYGLIEVSLRLYRRANGRQRQAHQALMAWSNENFFTTKALPMYINYWRDDSCEKLKIRAYIQKTY